MTLFNHFKLLRIAMPASKPIKQDRLDELSKLCKKMKVHKRAALNVRDQFQAVAECDETQKKHNEQVIETLLSSLCRDLQLYSTLTDLQSYLRQDDIARAIDEAHEGLWKVVQLSSDNLLQEQIGGQREIYEADRKIDRIGLRRLLRKCLREDSMSHDLERRPNQDIRSLINAVKLEITSPSIPMPDLQIYEDCLSRLEGAQSGCSPSHSKLANFTGQVVRVSENPVVWGAFCFVWTGEVYGRPVAIYTTGLDALQKGLVLSTAPLKSSFAWADFDHPNVLPLLGVCHNFQDSGDALISPWMENGEIIDYLQRNPKADRLKLITDIASGLSYLHTREPPYIHSVHSVLKASSILIDGNGNALIARFAWTAFQFDVVHPVLPIRRLAPELLRSNACKPTVQSDIYNFGNTIVEIMTGELPFAGMRSLEVMTKINNGERPPVSVAAPRFGLHGDLWDLVARCLSYDPAVRPTTAEALQFLQKMQELPPIDVRDLSHDVILDKDIRTVCAFGGFGEIRRGKLASGLPIALKTLSVKGAAPPVLRNTKRFRREATIWKQLKHPNVLPFLGTADISGLPTSLVSPWMFNGNCTEYFTKYPATPTHPIIQGIARGLVYLHSQKPSTIHGDLRGANVLISNSGEALLTDFGLAVIIEDLTQLPISSALQGSGNPRWMAPELFVDDNLVSKESDVWAFGMVVLEIVSCQVPFCEIKSYPQVILTLNSGGRPARPGHEATTRGLTDSLWALQQRCWAHDPEARPTADDVLLAIDDIVAGVI